MRIFTCTPVEFGGGPEFFSRDSGLMCRGFQSLGIESQAVMPGDRKENDEADLIRTKYANLESAEWWSDRKLDGVVLYAWGRPKFRKVAAAIHEAGVFLVLNQDNGGLVSPLAGFSPWIEEQWILAGQGRGTTAWMRFMRLLARGLTVGLAVTDPLRASHLKQGDVIACVSPKAAESYGKLCVTYGGTGLSKRIAVLPHAVEPAFRFSGGPKRRQLACVGRWQDARQKRPELLMNVIGSAVASDPLLDVVIAGAFTPEIQRWHLALPAGLIERVRLLGKVDRRTLTDLFQESQVFYSPSAYESFGIAAAEALCSGCSVVAERSVSMVSFDWFVSESSGTLALGSDASDHLGAIRQEVSLWEQGHRDPDSISNVWCARLHANQVAATVAGLIPRSVGDSPTLASQFQ